MVHSRGAPAPPTRILLVLALCAAACSEDAGELATAAPFKNAPGSPGPEVADPGGHGGGSVLPGHTYVWRNPAYLMNLPMSGPAWENLRAYATNSFVSAGPDTGRLEVALFNKDSNADVLALAKALVSLRSPDAPADYRSQVQQAVAEIMRDWSNPNAVECTDEPLALGRNLAGYIIAADYLGLDEPLASSFFDWLGRLYDEPLSEDDDCIRDDRSLHEIMRNRPNNWGTMAMGALAAIAAYRNDTVLLAEVRRVFHGWMGDRAAYADFGYGDLSWQPNPAAPVGVGPLHSSIAAGTCTFPTDGALPDELRRAKLCAPDSSLCGAAKDCDPATPGTQCAVIAGPQATCALANGQIQKDLHIYGTLAGAVVCAEILRDHGYPDVYEWEDQALRRAAQWLQDRDLENPAMGWWFSGDDTFVPWLINEAYGTSFPTTHNTNVGKNMDFTDWTHP